MSTATITTAAVTIATEAMAKFKKKGGNTMETATITTTTVTITWRLVLNNVCVPMYIHVVLLLELLLLL